jgi:hypothetical protein
VYQQTPTYFAPPMFGQPSGSYRQVAGGPPVQPVGVPAAPAASAKKKRKKKKNSGASGSQNAPPPQLQYAHVPFAPPQGPFVLPSGGLGSFVGPSSLVQLDSGVQSASAPDVAEVPAKPGKCWKCSVDTHATKDCKAQHYCLVCDTLTHPTLRCPTLKLPKPQAFVGGPACEESLCMRLPDSVFRAHLVPKGMPTSY